MEEIEKKKQKKQKRMSTIHGPMSGFEEVFQKFATSPKNNVDIMSIKEEDIKMEISTTQVKKKKACIKTLGKKMSKYTVYLFSMILMAVIGTSFGLNDEHKSLLGLFTNYFICFLQNKYSRILGLFSILLTPPPKQIAPSRSRTERNTTVSSWGTKGTPKRDLCIFK